MPYLGETPPVGSRSKVNATTTVGTGAEEDTLIKFDGNALDFRLGIDDGTDTMEIGKGGAHGTTAHMILDTNGIIRAPLQPAFSAIPASNQLNVSGLTALAFATEQFDTNADYNTSNSTFTAPVDGRYMMNLLIRWDNADSAADYHEPLILTSDGEVYLALGGGGTLAADGYFQQNGSRIIQMDAGDTAVARTTVSGGTAQADLSTYSTIFSGFLIG